MQGTVLNSWKVMWVVLADDAIEFYKKKTDNSPKGMIPLKDAKLTSPCQDFTKRTVKESRLFNTNILLTYLEFFMNIFRMLFVNS